MGASNYTVLKDFVDLQDNKHLYRMGDAFPRAGVDVSEERVAELASTKNKCRVPLIAKVEIVPEPDQEVKEKPKKKRTSKNAGANS